MKGRAPALALALAAAPLPACRSESADLEGHWQGVLDCRSTWTDPDSGEEQSLDYTTEVTMDLVSKVEGGGEHTGQRALTARWENAQGVPVVQWSLFDVSLFQAQARGAQTVVIEAYSCLDASLATQDAVVSEGCEDVAPGVGDTNLEWDGADTLTESGDCAGVVERVSGSEAAG